MLMYRIREILQPMPLAPVSYMPPYIKGVIHLRGKPIPVLDLREVRDPAAPPGPTSILVVQVNTAAGSDLHLGLIVDGAPETLTSPVEAPSAEPGFEKVPVKGQAKEAPSALLLNIDFILSGDPLEALGAVIK